MVKKRGRLEQRDNIAEIEKICAKREKKNVVRRSEWRLIKVVWIRAEKAL